MKIVLVGNARAIEQALLVQVLENFPDAQVICLSGRLAECDLFSLRSVESAVPEDVEIAFYFYQAEKPTAYLEQGKCSDYDLLVADNVARTLAARGVRKLMICCPVTSDVQSIFQQYKLPVVSLSGFHSPGTNPAPRSAARENELVAKEVSLPRAVRSIQKWRLPHGWDAVEAKNQYFSWLRVASGSVIRVDQQGDEVFFRLPFVSTPLLHFVPGRPQTDGDLVSLDIRGGLMADKNNVGRFEWRVVSNRRYIVAALHNYAPSLPWPIYRYTQALVHLMVMNCFGAFVVRRSK